MMALQSSPTAQREARAYNSTYSSHLPDDLCTISSAVTDPAPPGRSAPARRRMTFCVAGARIEARDRRETSRVSPREPWCPSRRPSGTGWEQQRPQEAATRKSGTPPREKHPASVLSLQGIFKAVNAQMTSNGRQHPPLGAHTPHRSYST